VWISFGDLPEATSDSLWKKRMEKQGLPPADPSDEVPF
jgi:hypothetical protein